MNHIIRITVITLILLFSVKSVAQVDSVYYYDDRRLVASVQIITPIGEQGIRENYTYFKHNYWLGDTDTILLKDLTASTTLVQKKKNTVTYQLYQNCDSIINYVRNRAANHASLVRVSAIEQEAIGSSNAEFAAFNNRPINELPDVHSVCSNEYELIIEALEIRQINKIKILEKSKADFYDYLLSNTETMDSVMIADFIISFNECEIDFKSIELIILNRPQLFMDIVNELTESAFTNLSFKLNFLPKSIDDNALKKCLKKTVNQTTRTKVLVKRIHTRKK